MNARLTVQAAVGLVLAVSFLLLGIAATAHAQVASGWDCHMRDYSMSVTTGFGAAYNPYHANKQLLINTYCTSSGATVTVGDGADTTIIWPTGYEYKPTGWAPITFTGTKSGEWIVGTANKTLTRTTAEQVEQNHIVAYTCMWRATEGAWRCGCRDTACTQGYWQLQTFKRMSQAELKYRILDTLDGVGLVCGSDNDPGAGSTTYTQWMNRYALATDQPEYYGAILARLGIAAGTSLSTQQQLSIAREAVRLDALTLTSNSSGYAFSGDVQVGSSYRHVAGTVSRAGDVTMTTNQAGNGCSAPAPPPPPPPLG